MVDFLANAFIELLLVMAILICVVIICAIISTFIDQLKGKKRKEEVIDELNEVLESIIYDSLIKTLEEEQKETKKKKKKEEK